MASKHDEFDDFLDDDEPDIVDTKADGRLLRVPLNRIAPNLVNPRTDFGTQEQLEDFGRSLKRRQLQAAPVVTRKAYLKLWPEHEARIGSVDVVIVSGERRFRAASEVALPALECVINDDVAASKRTFLDAVVSENIDRQNFDAIEEASAVDVLVEAFGTARAVAEHYERGDGWVSQRRVLLRLAPGVQALVRRRDMPLEPARKLGKLVKDHGWSEAEQLAWWEQEQRVRTQAAAEKKASRKSAPQSPPAPAETGPQPRRPEEIEPERSQQVFTAVKTQPEPDPVSASSAGQSALPEPRTSVDRAAPTDVPPAAPSPQPGREQPGPEGAMPWDDGPACADLAVARMQPEEMGRMIDRLLERLPIEDRHQRTTKLLRVMTTEKGNRTTA